jgi:hypothetical protein
VLLLGSVKLEDGCWSVPLSISSFQSFRNSTAVEERWRRVAARNVSRERVRQLDFEIARDMFDFGIAIGAA